MVCLLCNMKWSSGLEHETVSLFDRVSLEYLSMFSVLNPVTNNYIIVLQIESAETPKLILKEMSQQLLLIMLFNRQYEQSSQTYFSCRETLENQQFIRINFDLSRLSRLFTLNRTVCSPDDKPPPFTKASAPERLPHCISKSSSARGGKFSRSHNSD